MESINWLADIICKSKRNVAEHLIVINEARVYLDEYINENLGNEEGEGPKTIIYYFTCKRGRCEISREQYKWINELIEGMNYYD